MLDYASGDPAPGDRPPEPSAMSDSGFVLKTTPPRMSRSALLRERLAREADGVFDSTALAVVAPAGFGKTTLLLQWRQRWLEQGARVAWLSADAQDEPLRFAALLLHAVRGIGSVDQADVAGLAGMEAVTALLAGIARRRVQVVVVVDDAERLPAATVAQVLQYLLFNAPANLHIALGSRAPLPLRTAELLAHDRFRQLSVEELRLLPEESVTLLEARLGTRLDMDARMRLHDATEGWPIGLQLAVAAIEHEPDPAAAARALSARRGSLQDYFSDSMRAAFDDATMSALVRIAALDRFDTDLCEMACGAEAGELLQRLLRETPILIEGDDAGWFRLHPLARDYLLGLFERLPAAERADLHGRIAHWHAERQLFHQAAEHALAAGDEALAQAHAARVLWQLGAWGRVDEAREWLARMPGVLASPDPRLRLGAATVLAFSERNAEGLQMAMDVLADPAIALELRLVALRVVSSAAAYADQPDLLQALLDEWPAVPGELDEPLYRFNHLNVSTFIALHAGDIDRLHAFAGEAQALGDQGSVLLAAAVNRMLVGLGYLWEGNPGKAAEWLQPCLSGAERQHGRRSMIACLHASVLAQAMIELDRPEAVRLLLADRLDVIERAGFPDNILAAYRALAQAALARGDEAGAIAVLEGLDELARRRQLPRLRAHALAGRIRLLALKGCHESVAGLLATLDALAAAFDVDAQRIYQPEYRLVAAIARAHAALAGDDLAEAGRQLDAAAATATAMNRTRDLRIVRILRAVVAHKRGDRVAYTLLLEAVGLASLSGTCLLADAHPGALAMAADLDKVTFLPEPPPAPTAGHGATAAPSGLLTPKESEILGLLGRGMSNKRIALTLGIGAETVKWHLKNLFSKLSAGTREHAVDRARLLGLIGT